MEVKKGYRKTDVGVIPEHWEIINLIDKSTLKARIGWQGLTTKEYLDSGNYLLITGTDFFSGKIIFDTCNYVEKVRYEQDKNIQIRISDILITKDGTIGKIAYIDNLPKPATLNSGVFVIRPKSDSYLPKFVYYIFNSEYFNEFLRKLVAGSTINHLYQKDFISFKFPLPSSAEQHAIAEVLSDTDNLIQALEKQIAKKQLIKQGVIQKLLTAKEGWVKKKLGESSDIFRGGSPRPIESYLTTNPDGINWIKIGDVGRFAKFIESTEEKIIPEGMTRSRFVKEGDFLLSNSMSFGRPYILKTRGCIHDGWLVIQNYQNHFDREFLYYVLGSESVIMQYKAMASGSSVLNLNKEIVKNVIINCPISLKEQSRISAILSDIDNEINLLEHKLLKDKLIKQGLMQNLLTGKIRLFKS